MEKIDELGGEAKMQQQMDGNLDKFDQILKQLEEL